MNAETKDLKEQATMFKGAYMDALANPDADMDIIRNRLVEWQAAEKRYAAAASREVFFGQMTLAEACN